MKHVCDEGKDMPIEIIECFHALPIDVTENGVVSQQKIVAKVLAVKTRKEDVSVLVGNVSKMINQDKINIFNDQADLAGIVNPHPIVHAIPFRANNRYQHLLLSNHKQYMDLHRVPFFLHENIDRVIPDTRLDNYIADYANLTRDDNTLRRIIMALTNSQGNQVVEAIYSTQRSDFVVCCLQENSKFLADYCDLHALEYKNMWEKFDPNYESDMAKDMKALVAAIEVEENGFYMAPGEIVQAAQITPSAWKKKPRIATGSTTTPAAIRTELKRTEELISKSMQTAIQQLTASHAEQLKTIQDNHSEAMLDMRNKFEQLNTHSQQQGEMLNDLLEAKDRNHMQLTDGFEKLDKNIAANEESIEGIFQDVVKMQESSSKDRHTVVKALQQNMDTTTRAFQILSEEMTTIRNQVETMSDQADAMEESLDNTAEQVNSIFDSFVMQRRGSSNRPKRERSRSISSVRSSSSTIPRLTKKQQRGRESEVDDTQAEFNDMSVSGNKNSSNGGSAMRGNRGRHAEVLIVDGDNMSVADHSLSNSDDDGVMEDLSEGDEGEDDLDLSEVEGQATDTNSDDSEDMQTQEDGISQNIVSGSSQGEGSRG